MNRTTTLGIWWKAMHVIVMLSLITLFLPAGPAWADTIGATLSGAVFDMTSNTPLAGANVSVAGQNVTTDANGNYSVAGITTNNYDISASFAGFRTRNNSGLHLVAGQSYTQNIALAPGNVDVGNIRGFVVNAMSGAQLGGIKVTIADGAFRLTDGNGWFDIGDIPVGIGYNVTGAAYSGYLPRTATYAYAGEYWDLALLPEVSERGSISGYVTNASTQATVVGAIVTAGFGFATRTDANGAYTLDNLPPGAFYLQAFKTGFEAATSSQTVAQNGSYTLDMAMNPSPLAGWVWGYVSDSSNGARINGAVISYGGKTVSTSRVLSNWWDQGYYVIHGITAGIYTAIASHPAYMTFQRSVAINAQVENRMDFGLTPAGASQVPLAEIDQPAASAQITGVVPVIGIATDTDFSQYKVEYQLAQSQTWNAIVANQTVPVNQGLLATWDTRPLSAGQYTLKLTVEDKAANVSTATVTVQVVKTGVTITGTVLLQGVSSDFSGIRVYIRNTNLYAYTDVNGAFAINGALQGPAVIAASTRGYLAAEKAITVPESGSMTVGAVSLLLGDLNGDGIVDVVDLSLVAINANKTQSPWQ